MSLKKKRTTLADKINSLVTPAPINFDSDDEAEETKAKIVDYYDESDNSDNNIQISEIRKQNDYFLDQIDKRYKGKKVSRKDIFNKDNENFNIQNISKNENIDSIEEESDDETNDSNSEENIEDDDSNYEEDNDNK